LGAVAGPLANLLLAGLALLVWNAQINTYWNIATSFLGLWNLWLAAINLTPVFPLDGGRLTRAWLLSAGVRPASTDRILTWLGYALLAALAVWGAFLILQHDRYSLETGGATLGLALIYLLGILSQPRSRPGEGHFERPSVKKPFAILLGLVLFLMLAGASSTLLLTNNGLEAPGVALSVEPMVQIPADRRHPPAGTFILTSVLQQSPVPAGAWYLAKLDPSIRFLPPERIVPHQATAKETARQGYRQLDQSEITAVVVGLQKAGYSVEVVGKGVQVDSVLPESPNHDLLQPGDVITALNGKQVGMVTELVSQVKAQDAQEPVHLSVLRDQNKMDLTAKLLPPEQEGGSPKLGITVEDAGYDYKLPFPVKIVPQKIVGGPSAGLMFTLTVYNMLTPTDLTGGRKIAGTGTINIDGSVGPIGGVEQKVAAAEAAGAEYFLSPAINYADARAVARRIQVVKIETVDQALEFLKSLPPG
jgi:PDZ domain-containing protein